jgi:hypothetical protein
MRKTKTIVVDVNTPRKLTPLQEIREAVEARTQGGQSPVLTPGSGFLDYCEGFLPPKPVLKIDLDAILDSLGATVGEVGDGGQVILYDSMDKEPVLLALASRVTSTSFTLPTDATYVVDVWFDSLHADPEDMWQFTPDTSITTTAELPDDMLVQVLYVGIVE